MARTTELYGKAHQRRRAALLAELSRNPGAPCRRCGRPMYPDEALDLGHPTHAPALAGGVADELEHARCNRAAGGRTGGARRRRARLPRY